MSEDTTIRQQIVLEDKVTPALNAMMKAIQGTSSAMGALIDSVEQFEKVGCSFDMPESFQKVENAVSGVSSSLGTAIKSAQEFNKTVSNMQMPELQVQPMSGVQSQSVDVDSPALNQAQQSAEVGVSKLSTLQEEFKKLKGEASTLFAPATTAVNKFIEEKIHPVSSSIKEAMGNAKQHVSDLGKHIHESLDNVGESIHDKLQPKFEAISKAIAGVGDKIKKKIQPGFEAISKVATSVSKKLHKKFDPAFKAISKAGSIAARMIGNRMQAAVEVTKLGLNKVKKLMGSVASVAKTGFGKAADWAKGKWQSFKASRQDKAGSGGEGGLGGMLGGSLGKLAMLGGVATAAVAGFGKLATIASERTTQINSLNSMSTEKRNGLDGAEIQDYGVKYANRIGMSADDFTSSSVKLLKTTDAFGSIGEAMNFNELLQKQLKASGVTDAEAGNVTDMYSRGLMKGFDSRELKTIMEQAPALAESLAKAANVENPADLLNGKGKVTAQVAKDAIFGNADAIEKQFEQTPKTWNSIMERIKNDAAQALDPISQRITDLANSPAIAEMVDKLSEGFAWFSEVAGEAFDFVQGAIGTIGPYVMQVVTPIKKILCSVWDIIKGLITDIGDLFAKDEEFGQSAQAVWGDFGSILEGLKPIVEGFVNTIAGGIKILAGIAKNVMTLYENARTGLHNLFSEDELEYKSFDTDIFADGANQIANGIGEAVSSSVDLVGKALTKNLDPVLETPVSVEPVEINTNNDRIQAGITPTKPLHVKQVGKTKIDPESLQLLKELSQAEVINRINNIQPSIQATFGDVHETADVDAMLDRLEQEVVSARGQNLMMQTGMQYAY